MSEATPTPLRLGVVIVNFHTLEPVRNCLAALSTATRHPHAAPVTLHAVVVDNAASQAATGSDETRTSDHEAASLRMLCADDRPFAVDYMPASGNHGYAAGVNLGAARLMDGVDLLWVLNPDVEVAPDALAALARACSAGPPADLMATSLEGAPVAADGANAWISLWTSRMLAGPARWRAGSFGFPSGASVLATPGAWSALDGMDERYFLFYEDVDLAVRAHRGGLTVRALPDVVVSHHGGAATGTSAPRAQRPDTTQYYSSRSSVLFFARHFRRYAPCVVLARIALALHVLAAGERAAAAARLRGVVAGLARAGNHSPLATDRPVWEIAATPR